MPDTLGIVRRGLEHIPSHATKPAFVKFFSVLAGDRHQGLDVLPLAVGQAVQLLAAAPKLQTLAASPEPFTLGDARLLQRTLAKLTIEKEWMATVATCLTSSEDASAMATFAQTLRNRWYSTDIQAKVRAGLSDNPELLAAVKGFVSSVPEAFRRKELPVDVKMAADASGAMSAAVCAGDEQLQRQISFLATMQKTINVALELEQIRVQSAERPGVSNDNVEVFIKGRAMSAACSSLVSKQAGLSDIFTSANDDSVYHVDALDGFTDASVLGPLVEEKIQEELAAWRDHWAREIQEHIAVIDVGCVPGWLAKKDTIMDDENLELRKALIT